MAPDIRSFFGGNGGAVKPPTSTPAKETAPKKTTSRGRPRKVVSDDEDDVEEIKPKKSTPVKRKAVKEEPKEEETSSSAYFATSTTRKSPPSANGQAATPKKSTKTNGSAPSSARRSARKSTRPTYQEANDEDVKMKLDDAEDGGDDDIHADDFKRGRRADDYEASDSDELPLRPRKRSRAKKSAVKGEDDDENDFEIAEISTKSRALAGRKRKANENEAEEEEEDSETPKKKHKKPSTVPKKPRAKKEEEPDNSEARRILDSIQTVRAPTPEPRNEARKFDFKSAAASGNARAAPAGAGTKEIPTGQLACLTGLTFVFTGVQQTLGREEGQDLVKRYGGKVTTAPSSKTSYVVLGDDAGPKKLETIKRLSLKTIDEDGLFDMIRKMPAGGGDGKAASDALEKLAKQEEKLKADAIAEEKRAKEQIRQAEKAAKAAASARGLEPTPLPKQPKPDDRLWVDKYAPDNMAAICGNKALVERLQNWLHNWPSNHRKGFKHGGADGSGVFRAAMLHGPPGIGKTTSAHLAAKLEGYDIVESNASDTRSKKLVEGGLKGVLDTTSLLGYFAGDGKKVDAAKRKLVLIMDEVDGMSAGDRGGVGALSAVAKKTNIPMILICNDRKLPKMKPFDFVCADFAFRRPTVDMIRARIMTICFREGFRLPKEVIDAIIEGAGGDIRQIINMISTIKLDSKGKDMQFQDGKSMSKAWEKHIILKPWDIVNKILRAEMFAQASKVTLNEKIELYFNDHEFSYLMLQENYLKTRMAQATNVPPAKANLKILELAESAAASISDGDLVDRMIHGSQQHWSLMPAHAVFSFVRPASYTYGNLGSQVGFTSWLGNNSKQNKLARYVKEIQAHTRLRTSADRHEIRQQYMPALWNNTVGVMNSRGKDAVQDVIDFMDQYYLTKDDYDALLELGLGPMDQEKVNLDTQTKSAFTRMYNAATHPITHLKPGATGGNKLGGSIKRDKPDLEEAVEEDDAEEVAEVDADDDDEGEIDLKKDKYIKAPKKKSAAKGKGAAASKGKGKAKTSKNEDSELDDEDVRPEPKKRATAGAGRGRGRGRGKG